MRKRTKIGQKIHDDKVLDRKKVWEKRGAKVKVDLPGEKRPPKIGGITPDLTAILNRQLNVEEIETRSSLKSDKEQQEKLRNATKRRGGKFGIILAKRK